MMRATILMAGAFAVTGCADQKQAESEVIRNQVGRWAIVPAQDGNPAMVLDTVTGCVATATVAEDGSIVLNYADKCSDLLRLPIVDTQS